MLDPESLGSIENLSNIPDHLIKEITEAVEIYTIAFPTHDLRFLFYHSDEIVAPLPEICHGERQISPFDFTDNFLGVW